MYRKNPPRSIRGKAEYLKTKALTGLDRESVHLLQLHAVKRSCCPAANPGATGRLSPLVDMTTCFWIGTNSFASHNEAAMGGLIPYPIQ